jgi:hypothetical protein
MSAFILHFESPAGALGDDDLIVLEAANLNDAKMEAAMLYAGASFKAAPPTSFRILHRGAVEVYRFPETA